MGNAPITFIYTNSYDTTTDLLVAKLGSERVFRFNFNLWRDYRIYVDGDRFEIASPAGRSVGDRDIAKVLWRKPMRRQHMLPDESLPRLESYLDEELWYAMRELVGLLWYQGKLVLVEPFADLRAGKLIQARVARRYFNVPRWKFACGMPAALRQPGPSVAKSLTSERVGTGAVLYTTPVVESDLDPSTPWMLQDLVAAEKDVTIAFVRDRLFAFELPREGFLERTVDWRRAALETITNDWPVHELPGEMTAKLFAFMQDMGLHYGRIDMLYGRGSYHFLEVNSGGEWGWLDAEGKHGLLDKMLEEISPDTPVHSLPFARSLRL